MAGFAARDTRHVNRMPFSGSLLDVRLDSLRDLASGEAEMLRQ
jgi:hypothetical protein